MISLIVSVVVYHQRPKGDYAFISHMIETLKPVTGRMGVVVPHGVLFRGSSEGKIREKLINENLLDAVIGLPEKLFYGTGIPAAILIFKSKSLMIRFCLLMQAVSLSQVKIKTI